MTTPDSGTTDDQVIRLLTLITVQFCGALLLILGLGVFVLIPHGSVGMRGALVGAGLGLVSWFASRWFPRFALASAVGRPSDPARPSEPARLSDAARPSDPAGTVRTVAFIGIATAEAPALVGLALAMGGTDISSLVVAFPIAIAAVILNASGPPAVRRRLEQLRG